MSWQISLMNVFLVSAANIKYSFCMTTDSEFLLSTHELPKDVRFMPTLANGHLGITVFGDAILINGIYNGAGGQSRRARIPNWLNITVSRITYGPQTVLTLPTSYEMDLYNGYFHWNLTVQSKLSIEQRIYPHRYYSRALVYELLVHRHENIEEEVFITIQQKSGSTSEDFDFFPHTVKECDDRCNLTGLKAVTRIVEHPRFQENLKTVYIISTEDLQTTEKSLAMKPGQKRLNFQYIITIDENEAVAKQEIQDMLRLKEDEIFRAHASLWNRFWNEFSIKLVGNLELSRTINAGIFYLACCLPSLTVNQPNKTNIFFGISPTGLGRGTLEVDYLGHNFWDTEIWMLPVVEQLNPLWAEALLKYRVHKLEGAQFNAMRSGFLGARFPWESAYTGLEVTQPCCPEVAEQEIHISADIIFAIQQHYAITNNREWLCEVALNIVLEIATYLEDRVEWNAYSQKYHINNVMGPDENSPNVNNSVYTNVIFKIALEFASFTERICVPKTSIPFQAKGANWLNIAEKILILFDEERNYHPEYSGYEPSKKIKQADVVLLGYPLQFPINITTRQNDLCIYENAIELSGPAMSWSMFAINYLDVGDAKKADLYFKKSYTSYVDPIFKVWSEVILDIKDGAVNFLTGVGGFLQAVLNGYANLKFYKGKNGQSEMRIENADLPPDTQALTIKGIHFASAQFILTIDKNSFKNLKCSSIGGKPLELLKAGEVFHIQKGFSVQWREGSITIRTERI